MAHVEAYRSATLMTEVGFYRSFSVQPGESIALPDDCGAILLWADGATGYALTATTAKSAPAEQWRRVRHLTDPFLIEVEASKRRLWLR